MRFTIKKFILFKAGDLIWAIDSFLCNNLGRKRWIGFTSTFISVFTMDLGTYLDRKFVDLMAHHYRRR